MERRKEYKIRDIEYTHVLGTGQPIESIVYNESTRSCAAKLGIGRKSKDRVDDYLEENYVKIYLQDRTGRERVVTLVELYDMIRKNTAKVKGVQPKRVGVFNEKGVWSSEVRQIKVWRYVRNKDLKEYNLLDMYIKGRGLELKRVEMGLLAGRFSVTYIDGSEEIFNFWERWKLRFNVEHCGIERKYSVKEIRKIGDHLEGIQKYKLKVSNYIIMKQEELKVIEKKEVN